MRILHAIDIGYPAGGAERSVVLLKRAFAERGHDIVVVATDKDIAKGERFADVLVPTIAGSAPLRLVRKAHYGAACRVLERVVNDFRPDVAHLHTIGEFSPAIFRTLRTTPTVLTIHGPEDFTARLRRWQLPAGDYRHKSYESRDLRMVGRFRSAYLAGVQRPLYLLGLRHVDCVVAPSRFMAEAIKPETRGRRVEQIYNGIELNGPYPLGTEPVILYAGRLAAVKGVDTLLVAMATVIKSVPNARLVVVGDGPERTHLEDRARDLGINERVEFKGWLDGVGLDEEYRRCRVVAIPSIWPENLPTVALEAIAAGRPIVGAAVGGIPELVTDGVNGRVVPPQDPIALSSALVEVCSDDHTAKDWAGGSLARREEFSLGRFVDRIEHLYREVGWDSCE